MATIPVRLAEHLPQHTPPTAPRGPARPHATRPGDWWHKGFFATIAGLFLLACWRTIVPPVADELANHLPAQWVRSASEQRLSLLDHTVLRPSATPRERQSQLSAAFARMNAPAVGTPPYRLIFRASSAAPVFSLPNGDIVVSDELLNTLNDDRLILAVLCRELGRLNYRHTLRTILQAHLPALTLYALAGGEHSASAALARYLDQTPVSIAFDRQAEDYALAMLKTNGLPPVTLAAAQSTLTAKYAQP